MSKIENVLRKLAEFEYKNASQIFFIAVLLTLFFAIGALNVTMQTDITKELPQDLPVIKLQRGISDRFGSGDMILLLVQIDKESTIKTAVKDIREPRVIESLLELQSMIEKEKNVNEATSIASIFEGSGIPSTLDGVKMVLSQVPDSNLFFNRDYSATLMYISGDFAGSEERVKNLVSAIQDDVESVTKPPGVKIAVTGNPPVRVTMMGLLKEDAVYTISVAGVIIFLLMLLLTRSLTKSILIFVPLLFGVIWTLGTMGWLNIPLSIATTAIGAMIMGLGVEYGAFIVHRYYEERVKGKSELESLSIAVPGVGTAIAGSATTTIVGFLALLMVSMPMIQNLGITLALGIFYCWFIVIMVNPVFIALEGKFVRIIRGAKLNSRGI